jgi:NTE family protein
LTTAQRLGLLKCSPLLRQLSNTVLLRLLRMGEEQVCPGHEWLSEKEHVFLVLEGLVSVRSATAGPYCVRRGDVVGLEEYLRREDRGFEVRSIGNTLLLRFSWKLLDQLARVCTPWRQFLEQQSRVFPFPDVPDSYSEVVAFESRVASVSPRLLSVLIHLVAKEIVQSFHETVQVLSGPGSGFPLHGTRFIPGGAGVERISGLGRPEVSPDKAFHSCDYVFLDNHPLEPGRIHKTVYLTDSKVASTAAGNTAASSAALERIPGTVLPTVLLNKGSSPSGERLQGMPPAQTDDQLLPPCRTLFNWQLLERLSPADVLDRPLDELGLDEGTRDSLSRWARAITCRRVGVGLSGGGAWGFYHVVLLRKLLAERIPIDIISGASMGSLVGAAYCTQGEAGLCQLVELANDYKLSLTALLSIVNTLPIELLVDRTFGTHHLEELLTIFHPGTTDLSDGMGVPLEQGPLGLAVRASSSAPGVFGPTLNASNRYVDGCVSDNLPVTTLIGSGADFTFASNCYPAAISTCSQLIPGKLGAVLSELNPLGRVQDLFISGSIALSSLGAHSALLANVAYDPQPTKLPLLKSIFFTHVNEILDMANRDTQLDEAIARFKYLWDSTKRRVGVPPRAREAA